MKTIVYVDGFNLYHLALRDTAFNDYQTIFMVITAALFDSPDSPNVHLPSEH